MIKVTQENKKVRFIAFNLFIFSLSIYLLTASVFNIYHTDAGKLRIAVVKSIVERQDLSVPEGIGMKGNDGREYSWAGIGSALLAVPFYMAGEIIGATPEIAVSAMNQIFGAATVVLVYLFAISLGYANRSSLLTAIFYGLGTVAWPLAKGPFDYTIAACFVLLSIYFMYLYVVDNKFLHLLISAISIGVAFITRTNSILVIPPLLMLMIFYSVKKPDFRSTIRPLARDVVFFSVLVLPFISLSLWYNYYRFGSVFETGYSLIALRTGIEYFKDTSMLTGLSGFLISPGKGFFYYSPVSILFFFSIRSFIKKHSGLALCFICLIVSYLLFHSKYLFWHGGWSWGPRHIFVITPFLIIPIAGLLDTDTWSIKIFRRRIVYSIFAVSLLIQMAAVSVDFQKYYFYLATEEKVQFTIASGEGVQQITTPPVGTLFSWETSPIFTQFKFIYSIASKLKDYRYSKPPDNATLSEQVNVSPYMNVFDFWWLYEYFLYGSYLGFIAALLLLLAAIYSGSRLWKLSNLRSGKL